MKVYICQWCVANSVINDRKIRLTNLHCQSTNYIET